MFERKRVAEAVAMFTKATELAPNDFEIAFTAAGYLRYGFSTPDYVNKLSHCLY